jgi:PmbA protein
MTNLLNIAEFAVNHALKSGANEADSVVVKSTSLSVRQRMKNPEFIERSESQDLGLRVFIGQKGGYQTAIISTNNLGEDNIKKTVERAIAIAKLAPKDEYYRLAEKGEYSTHKKDLDLYCNYEPSEEQLKNLARETEEAALSVKNVINSDGADAGFGRTESAIYTSKGFSDYSEGSSYSISTSVIAGNDDGMETDYDYSSKRHFEDLESPAIVGRNAGEYAAKKLSPRRVKTCKVPIIYDSKVASDIVANLCSAINGETIARGSSFLKDKMGKQIFPKGFNIIDNPLIKRGPSSRPFDGEGIECEKSFFIEDGVLKTWVLDIRTAAKLGLKTTGHAARGISSHPSPASSNVYLEAGKKSPAELIKEVKTGLYLTDTFGMGVNIVTGDYSQGAVGFWIENGEIAYPVSEITIAGNLNDMFMNIETANDLEFRYSKNAPTLRIDGMTIAGE